MTNYSNQFPKLDSMALRWSTEKFEILDQTLLPLNESWETIANTDQMIQAIKALKVRGAPLIGVVASMALAQSALKGGSKDQLLTEAKKLYEARPTAVNLMNCMDRMTSAIQKDSSKENVIQNAIEIFIEDVELCNRIANNGADLIKDGDRILTHCNTGGLATAGVGTALGIIRKAHEQGKKIHVYVDETRPLLQGARLTAWELQKLKIPMTLITDSMAAHLMSLKKIDRVFVGSDRIAANGDFANKIGTYGVAIHAHYHKVPFYVAAPFTTVDPECVSGENIPIEQRIPQEVWGYKSLQGETFWVPSQTPVYNPSFDVTPHSLVTGWVMDKGLFNQNEVSNGIFKRG
jgi:methylthioribose-1-phosphate isomerase